MSLSNDAVVLVLKALKGITSDPDQCFTSYDVTKATRSLTNDNIRHDDVREVIHTFYDRGFLDRYVRQDHSFFHTASQDYHTAKLFIPPNGDPYAYDPDRVQMVKSDGQDGTQILLQDSAGNTLVTSDGPPLLTCSDAEDDENSNAIVDVEVVDRVAVSSSPATNQPIYSTPGGPDMGTAKNKTARSRSLFDQIKDKLTRLPGKFFGL